MIKRIAIILSVLSIIFAFSSCAKDNSALISELPSLIEEGRELLDIVYGEGLETDSTRAESVKRGYEAVSEKEEYQSRQQLEDALKKVFSKSYVIVLYNTALNDISYDPSTLYPRYIEKNGILYADTTYESQIAKRNPKIETIKITDSNRFMAEFEMTMVYEDGKEEVDTFLVVKEDGKWKLDSAVL